MPFLPKPHLKVWPQKGVPDVITLQNANLTLSLRFRACEHMFQCIATFRCLLCLLLGLESLYELQSQYIFLHRVLIETLNASKFSCTTDQISTRLEAYQSGSKEDYIGQEIQVRYLIITLHLIPNQRNIDGYILYIYGYVRLFTTEIPAYCNKLRLL